VRVGSINVSCACKACCMPEQVSPHCAAQARAAATYQPAPLRAAARRARARGPAAARRLRPGSAASRCPTRTWTRPARWRSQPYTHTLAARRYCRFALLKENLDTAGALAILQRHLRCGKAALATAGTKDKRAITCQHVTAFKARAGTRGCRWRPARSAAGAGALPCLPTLSSADLYACGHAQAPKTDSQYLGARCAAQRAS